MVSNQHLAEYIANNSTVSRTEADDIANAITGNYHILDRDEKYKGWVITDEDRLQIDNNSYGLSTSRDAMEAREDSIRFTFTIMEAAQKLVDREADTEVTRLTNLLHSISDVSLEDAREQAEEMYAMGARFLPAPAPVKNQ